jgi:tRNA-Thr(GGU) m(6)t(6)A37 methyltransferase TsaA
MKRAARRYAMSPIGVVRSPYSDTAEIPRGAGARHEAEGTLELQPELEAGLADIEGFSHLYVLWIFDRAEGCDLLATPPTDTRPHGVFATRSPRRPNPIGLTVVRLIRREGLRLHVRGLDMLDGTPILDIKPYLSSVPEVELRRGWLDEAERGAPVRVRRAAVGDEPVVRDLRLLALSDAPDAFDSTPERERAMSAADWRKWIAATATFIAETPDGPRGIAAGVPYRDHPGMGLLISMWVHPDLRGTRAADSLVESVLGWAEAEGLAELRLHVGKHNDRARRCYERNGFRPTGEEFTLERSGIVEIEMARTVGRRAAGGPRPVPARIGGDSPRRRSRHDG